MGTELEPSITPAELAALEKRAVKTIYEWCRRGLIAHYRTPGGDIRIPASEVRRIRQSTIEPQ